MALALATAACSTPATTDALVFDVPSSTGTKDAGLKFTKDATDLGEPDTGAAEDTPADESADIPDDVAPDEGPDVQEPEDIQPEDVPCVPKCGIHVCGDNGCGGSCGECTDKQMCSVGKCVTDPKLGCAGLDLPVNWKGTFQGDMTFSVLGLIPAESTTKGSLEFSIKCLNSKFLVNGIMSGTASKLNPFSLNVTGTYDPATKKIDAVMLDGEATVFFVVQYFFGGTLVGELDATNTFNGNWQMSTTSMKLLGSGTAGQIVPLTGNGTWTATGGP